MTSDAIFSRFVKQAPNDHRARTPEVEDVRILSGLDWEAKVWGSHVSDVARVLCDRARATGRKTGCDFNGCMLIAYRHSTPDQVVASWHTRSQRDFARARKRAWRAHRRST